MMAGREHQQWPRLNYSSGCHNYERLDLVALDREAEVQQLNLADRRIAHAGRVISAQMLPTANTGPNCLVSAFEQRIVHSAVIHFDGSRSQQENELTAFDQAVGCKSTYR
jgi:hypothetical protein